MASSAEKAANKGPEGAPEDHEFESRLSQLEPSGRLASKGTKARPSSLKQRLNCDYLNNLPS